MLYAVRCLKSNEDMILALAGQFKQLSHEPEKFRWLNGIRTHDQLSYEVTQRRAGQFVGLMFSRIISSFDFKHRTAYNISFIWHSFHGKTWAQQIDLLSAVWLHSSVGQSTAPASQRSWVRIPLSHLNFSGSWDNCLNCPASARIISSFDFKHRTALRCVTS